MKRVTPKCTFLSKGKAMKKINILLGCMIAGNLFSLLPVYAQTPDKTTVPKSPIVVTTMGETKAMRQARREAWKNSPQGKRAAERDVMMTQAGELISKGKFLDARKLIDVVLAEAPNDPISSRAVEGLGEIARITGDNATALRYYRDFMSVKPGQTWITSRTNDPVVRLKYALLLQDAGAYDEAWNSYQLAQKYYSGWILPQPSELTREQVSTAMFKFVASLAIANGLHNFDDAQAATFARAAAKANPASGLPHYYAGRLLMGEDASEAKAEFEKAVRYGHGDYVKNAEDYLRFFKLYSDVKTKPKSQIDSAVPNVQ